MRWKKGIIALLFLLYNRAPTTTALVPWHSTYTSPSSHITLQPYVHPAINSSSTAEVFSFIVYDSMNKVFRRV